MSWVSNKLDIRRQNVWMQFFSYFRLGMQNLTSHKLRSLLTMLGMIFGVAAVVSMLSIGAGAEKEIMAFIEQLGIHNVVVEAKESTNFENLQKTRKSSAGLTFQDLRIIKSTVNGIVESTARKHLMPGKMLPKPQQDMPVIYGVEPNYQKIANLKISQGRFYDEKENEWGAPVCVLGKAAQSNIFGLNEAVGSYVKVNEQWLHVIGIVSPQVQARSEIAGVSAQDPNNLIYVPLYTAIFRLYDNQSYLKDEIDGIYFQLLPQADSVEVSGIIRTILNVAHREVNDFSIIVPAELLAQRKKTQRIFEMVMVAIASISLLVGGIGIMNIMLASILERTREIGVRRAIGARRRDVILQFLLEAILISFVGGILGVVFGFAISKLIAALAGWSTIVTASSILLAFLVSVSIGLIFGSYPAMKAAKLDPVEAIRYE